MMKNKLLVRLGFFATFLALIVVMLGAYVRLSDAGLGCPDWPGCYGHLGVPATEHTLATANQNFPERPVEAHKAWKEMVHRYLASSLGLLIIIMAVVAWQNRKAENQAVALSFILVGLVMFQGALGMWTVTWKLQPLVVTGHLLGGMTTLTLLWWFSLKQSGWLTYPNNNSSSGLRLWAFLAIFVVAGQIFLGGWTSTNYAALICPDFPTCQGAWLPETDFAEAFVLWRELGINYEFGVLEQDARTAIHFAHRLGAIATFLFVLGLVVFTLRSVQGQAKNIAWWVLFVLCLQVGLGISNIVFALPLTVAVAHQGGAAFLLLSIVALNHALRPVKTA